MIDSFLEGEEHAELNRDPFETPVCRKIAAPPQGRAHRKHSPIFTSFPSAFSGTTKKYRMSSITTGRRTDTTNAGQPPFVATPLPSLIRETLHRLRLMIHRYVVMQSIILASLCGIGLFWLMGLFDYFPVTMGASESPRWARLLMLILWFGSIVAILVRVGLVKRFVQWRDSSLALLLERRFPQLQSSLITTVQSRQPLLTPKDDHSVPSDLLIHRDPKLLEMTEAYAVKSISDINLESVLHWRPLQLQSAVLGGTLGMSLLLALWQPAWTLHWASRLFLLSPEPWPRMTKLGLDGIEIDVPRFSSETDVRRYIRPFEEGVATIPRGQNARLLAFADMTAKRVPDSCMITYRTADSRQGRASLRRLSPLSSSQQLPFVLEGPPLEAIDQSLALSVSAGDARIAGLRLDLIDAPQLNELKLGVKYPSYLRQRSSSLWLDEIIEYRTGLRLPQGTEITLLGKGNMPLKEVDVHLVSQAANPNVPSNAASANAASGVGKIEMEKLDIRIAKATGNQFELGIGNVDNPLLMEFRPWEETGHSSTRVQQYVLGVMIDEVPSLDLKLDGIGTAVTDQAILPIVAKVVDDHDIQSSWTELVLNEDPVIRIPVQVGAEGVVNHSIDLRLMRDSGEMKATPGQTISMTLAANDYYDLGNDPRIGRASPIQLAVVTPDQLLIMLERRELAMRSRMELIVAELNQLRELIVKVANSNKEPAETEKKPITESDSQSADSKPSDSKTSNDEQVASPAEARNKLQLLRVQQAVSQVEKSTGELSGVAQEIGQINRELINNRIDSQDRQDRLENKVRIPIEAVIQGSMAKLTAQLKTLEQPIGSGPVEESRISDNQKLLAETLVALEAILQDMADIQDFNEVVDMVRSMIEEQEKIIDQTKSEQKKRVLDLFK